LSNTISTGAPSLIGPAAYRQRHHRDIAVGAARLRQLIKKAREMSRGLEVFAFLGFTFI
jgi:hypothetical protein